MEEDRAQSCGLLQHGHPKEKEVLRDRYACSQERKVVLGMGSKCHQVTRSWTRRPRPMAHILSRLGLLGPARER